MILDKNAINKEFLQKVVIGAVVLVLVVFVAWRFFLAPLHVEKAKAEAEVVAMKAKLETNQSWVAKAEKTDKAYEAIRTELRNITEQYMPPPVNAMAWAGDVLRNVTAKQNSRAKPRSIAETGISAAPTAAGNKDIGAALFEEYNIRSEMICSYHDFGRYLAALEKANAYLRVAGIEIKPSTEEKELLAISVRASFLRFNDEAFLPEERPDAETPRIRPKETAKAKTKETKPATE